MVMVETPIKPSILDELSEDIIVEEARWNDVGLTAEDLAQWLAPGFPYPDCELLDAIVFPPAD